ncbi:hypothetical protein BKA82DRAFT_27836 [Pisolithus tinctorius]|uniref:Non-haem dioxygenase N-terminal domain-containing protein n=1 Tax=Pisolithus tinctorius Marx 270 TaxID=870435 RepID=A0A0C3J0K8_PISTI|nr:hypothetical protein BKA82DRAFT_27836 [Pisolithus tinctorius]KIO02623.1 hypothetical protein M404DRAFT_27836 [Pisolithus tinctorius Marx 270]
MSVTASPPVPHYNAAPPTNADLDYADLPTINLSKMESAQCRATLASQVRDALLTHGFFYIVNHGYSQAQTDRMFDITDVPFSCVSDEEKRLYADIDQETGWYRAYKLRQHWHIDAVVRDHIEFINNRDVHKQGHPEALRPSPRSRSLLGSITPTFYLPSRGPSAQSVKCFFFFAGGVQTHCTKLIALSLELPEDALVKLYNCNGLGEAFINLLVHLLYTIISSTCISPFSYLRSAEDEEKINNVWFKGHTGLSKAILRLYIG